MLRLGVMFASDLQSMVNTTISRNQCGFNRSDCPVSSSAWSRRVANKHLQNDPHARIGLADMNPGVVALFFENCVRVVTAEVLKRPVAGAIKKSSPVKRGVCGKISSADVVVQMQGNRTQRLHYHIIARLFVSNVELFDLCACDPTLASKMGSFLDSVSCCSLNPEARAWQEEEMKMPFEERKRSGNVHVPDPAVDYPGFVFAGEKRTSMTLHAHTKTCTKTWRGKFGCRLALPRSTSEHPTRPMIVKLIQKCNYPKNESAKMEQREITVADIRALIKPVNYGEGQFVRVPVEDPVLWIENRPVKDALVPEHHPVLAAMFPTSHHNMIVSSNAGAEKIDEYAISYVAPSIVGTEGGDSQVHLWCSTALDNMEEYPTQASDKDDEPNIRAARTLGQKVVNGVTGRTEYSLTLMAYANLGHDAHESSHTHAYSYHVSTSSEYKTEHAKPHHEPKFQTTNGDTNTSITKRLKKMIGEASPMSSQGGSRRFSVVTEMEGVKKTSHLFVTQAQIYAHRPFEFASHTADDLEATACVVPVTSKADGSPKWRFRRESQLYETHVVMLRRLQRTPLPGQTLPRFPGNKPIQATTEDECPKANGSEALWEKEVADFAHVMVTSHCPWTGSKPCDYQPTLEGLQQMMVTHDNSNATMVCKSRGELVVTKNPDVQKSLSLND